MTESTHLMLCTVFACTGGYSDEILRKYKDVFQMILDNDKYLQGQEWNSHTFYKHEKKYFEEEKHEIYHGL